MLNFFLTCILHPPPHPTGTFLRWHTGYSRRRSELSRSSCPETERDAVHISATCIDAHIHFKRWLRMAGSNLESWGTAAPVDLRQVAVTDALVETGTGQTGVALGQHFGVHVS